MSIKNIFRAFSVFSIFSVSSLVVFLVALLLVLLGYVGVIDIHGKVIHVANELLSKETGLPVEEIEDIEGISKQKKK